MYVCVYVDTCIVLSRVRVTLCKRIGKRGMNYLCPMDGDDAMVYTYRWVCVMKNLETARSGFFFLLGGGGGGGGGGVLRAKIGERVWIVGDVTLKSHHVYYKIIL